MKKIVFLILILIAAANLYAQNGTIKIYTELEEETSWIMVWLNEEPQDAFPSDEVEIEDLYSGKYELRVSFNSDTIADWVKEIKLKRNEKIEFKVVKLKEFGKDVGKVGRGFGQKFGKTDENDAEDLVQYYRLERVKEE
jgi:hypothetical protein